MKKRFVSLLVCLVMVLALFPTTAFAAYTVDSGYCGEDGGSNLRWTLDSEGVLTISGRGAMESYQSEYKQEWRDHFTDIKEVVIKSGVTSIGDYAFCNLRYMTHVTIPNSVIAIGDWAFEACFRLTEITIPNGVKTGVRTKSWTKQRPQGGSRYIVHIRKESPRPAII